MDTAICQWWLALDNIIFMDQLGSSPGSLVREGTPILMVAPNKAQPCSQLEKKYTRKVIDKSCSKVKFSVQLRGVLGVGGEKFYQLL